MLNLDHPYRSLTGGQWLRGNLHTHTTATDGKYKLFSGLPTISDQ